MLSIHTPVIMCVTMIFSSDSIDIEGQTRPLSFFSITGKYLSYALHISIVYNWRTRTKQSLARSKWELEGQK